MGAPSRVAVVPDGPECPNCSGTVWTVGIVGSTEAGGTLDLMPAPMARCVGCNLSGRYGVDTAALLDEVDS